MSACPEIPKAASTHSYPFAQQYVFTTRRYSGWTLFIITTLLRFRVFAARTAASAIADAPSYMEAFATCIPVRRAIIVWYS